MSSIFTTRPAFMEGPFRWLTSVYGVQTNGGVCARHFTPELPFLNRRGPAISPERGTSKSPTGGVLFGDVVSGEGTHDPVVRKSALFPGKKIDNVIWAIERQREKEPATGPSLVDSAARNGTTGFGTSREKSEPQELTERWTVNGDGTVSDRKYGLTWIQGAWGTTWNGNTFIGSPEPISWKVATRLFGKGVFAYSSRQNGPYGPEEWEDSHVRNGYHRGKCTVNFAGHTDWRLPTAFEAATLRGCREVEAELFPGFGTRAFCTATGGNRFLFVTSWVWKGRVGGHVNDENPDVPYPVLFVRES